MKRTFTLLVMTLALVFLLAGVVPAVLTPPIGPYDPVDGTGEGEDGDHPWGGDRVIGTGGSTTTRTVYATALTGNTAIDLFIFNVLNTVIYPKPANQDQYEILNSRTYTGYRNRLSREVAR